MNRKKNYPLYQTTVFEDFRIMTENVAKRYPDRYAFTYKKNPRDTEVVHVTYAQAREYIRALGTGEVELGMREEKVAIIGDSNYNWVMAYFSLMSIGAVTIPIDKDLPVQDIASILNTAECKYIFYSGSIDEKVKELLNNPEIIRSKNKILASINNAKIFINIQKEYGTFADYIWSFTAGKIIKNKTNKIPVSTELSDKISKDLKKRGMKYTGTVIIYSYLQAIGVVNDHETECFKYKKPIHSSL